MLHHHCSLLGSRTLSVCRRLAKMPLHGTSLRHRVAFTDAGRATVDQVVEWIVDESQRRGMALSAADASRIVTAAQGLRFRPYARATRRDMHAVIAYFSPVGFTRPLANLQTVVRDLLAADIPVTVAEAVMPGAEPLVLPEGVQHLQWDTESVLFLKENLFNLSIPYIDEPKILQLDGDVRFLSRQWWDRTSEALDSVDIVQPFDVCWWLGPRGGVHHEKRSIVEAFPANIWPDLRQYHPGFAWAFRRDFLDRIGGIYELHAVGGGDTALAFAIAPQQPSARTLGHWVRLENLFHETGTFKAWMARVRARPFAVDYLRSSPLVHLFHGTRERRRYDDRSVFLPGLVSGEYPIRRRADGLIEWIDPQHSERVLEYFRSREEDE